MTSPFGMLASLPKPKPFNNLYVSNLPRAVSNAHLLELFEPFGAVVSSKVMIDVKTGVSRGYGFVRFSSEDEGCKAFQHFHHRELQMQLPGVDGAGPTTEAVTLIIEPSEHVDPIVVESRFLYVRNIPKSVSSTEVLVVFRRFGCVTGMGAMKPIPEQPGLFMCALELDSVEAARAAIAATNATRPFEGCLVDVFCKFADAHEPRERAPSAAGQPYAAGAGGSAAAPNSKGPRYAATGNSNKPKARDPIGASPVGGSSLGSRAGP